MRIVLPVHHFPPGYSAGAELYTLRLAQWLVAHGHDVEVVAIEQIDVGNGHELRETRDRYQGIAVRRLAYNLEASNDAFVASYNHPLLYRWFSRYLAEVRPDVVHNQAGYLLGISSIRAANELGIPQLLTLHDFWFLCPRITLLRGDGRLCQAIPENPAGCMWCMQLESRRFRVPEQLSAGLAGQVLLNLGLVDRSQMIQQRRATLNSALKMLDLVIAPSQFMASQFRSLIEEWRLTVVRLGLDSTRLAQLGPRPDDGVLRIGYVGQIAPHKGVHVLVEAVRSLQANGRPYHLRIHGDTARFPEYSRRLQRLIANDQHIELAGRFEPARLADVLSEVDVTVTPSIWYENSPLAILEAQMAGRPVLVSALGGMAELVHHEVDGLHFHPGDATELARQLQRLRDDPTLLPRLRSGIVPPPTIDTEMRILISHYERVQRRTLEQTERVEATL